MVDDIIDIAVTQKIPSCVFMFPSNLCDLKHKPDQICHWIKQPSTKNTCKRYSNFVEVIAIYGATFYELLHWTNRCGIFQDALFTNKIFEWKKPDSLIERLIRNHYSGSGIVYDPCAGSGTTHDVCKKMGIPSICIEIEPKWRKL